MSGATVWVVTASALLVALLAGGFSLLGVVAGFLFRTLEARTQRSQQFSWDARQKEFQAAVERSRHLFDARHESYIAFRLTAGEAREDFREAAADADRQLSDSARTHIWNAFGPVQFIGGDKARQAALALLRYADKLAADPSLFSEDTYRELALNFMEVARSELIGLTETPPLLTKLSGDDGTAENR